jgi:hypothetical protein
VIDNDPYSDCEPLPNLSLYISNGFLVNLNTLDDAFERRAFEDELDTVWESPDGISNDTLGAYESYVKESNSDKTPKASRGIFVRRISQSSFRISLIFGDRSKSLSVLKSGQRTIYSSP